MADFTTNYNLKKPASTDFYNVEDFNGNADIIDGALDEKLNKDFSNASGGAVPIENGGTGATTASAACANLGALPLVGGTLTGQVSINYDYVGEASFTVTNPNGSVQLSVNNSRGLYDKANSKWVVKSDPGSNTWSFLGTADSTKTLWIQQTQPDAPNNSLWAW